MEQHIVEKIRENKEYLRKKYSITKIGIFGSYARGEEDAKSDLDVLVEFENTPGLFGFFSVEEYLESVLDKKIDLVRVQGLKEQIKDNVLSEVIFI